VTLPDPPATITALTRFQQLALLLLIAAAHAARTLAAELAG
jgi:hypothetical protein